MNLVLAAFSLTDTPTKKVSPHQLEKCQVSKSDACQNQMLAKLENIAGCHQHKGEG